MKDERSRRGENKRNRVGEGTGWIGEARRVSISYLSFLVPTSASSSSSSFYALRPHDRLRSIQISSRASARIPPAACILFRRWIYSSIYRGLYSNQPAKASAVKYNRESKKACLYCNVDYVLVLKFWLRD